MTGSLPVNTIYLDGIILRMERNFPSWNAARKELRPVVNDLHLKPKVFNRFVNEGFYIVPDSKGKLTAISEHEATEDQKVNAMYHVDGLFGTSPKTIGVRNKSLERDGILQRGVSHS